MSDAYIGDIRMWAFSWPPSGWLLCDGTVLPISKYQALFSVIGTAYGGDGQTNFQLPDLRGRVEAGIGVSAFDGTNYAQGAKGGLEAVVLTNTQVPTHTHVAYAVTDKATQTSPSGNFLATAASNQASSTLNYSCYVPANQVTNDAVMYAGMVGTTGASAAHNNMQPFTVVNFCICTSGIYPPRP